MKTMTWMKAALIGLVTASAVGCAGQTTLRDATFTHWHDDQTLIVVYERQQSKGIISTTTERSTHVRVCKVQETNELLCRDQLRVANMLNPHLREGTDLSDPWSP
ncbi:hypothetical protein FRC98_20505 [Lujinxingia vulgaris]|uniref:Lipoprotein n=1 Tax=Lujinxingia vulgaris TaxID=2600176 RepID=A0A5C6WW88_9DELT|nr:hypothetical protein [Lujinxingia vulgaris]TXD33530.1 hypothetical protein FRC98_20505 [Lujinxingia vulgaris]